jgi:hypothetical protein
MQTFFPCSNAAYDDGMETPDMSLALPAGSARGAAGRVGDWRESAEDDDVCV